MRSDMLEDGETGIDSTDGGSTPKPTLVEIRIQPKSSILREEKSFLKKGKVKESPSISFPDETGGNLVVQVCGRFFFSLFSSPNLTCYPLVYAQKKSTSNLYYAYNRSFDEEHRRDHPVCCTIS